MKIKNIFLKLLLTIFKKEIKEQEEIMRQRNEVNLDRLNRIVENYNTVEVVAVPPDFDIKQYLSMRESAGIFKHKGIDLKNLSIIADAVKSTPVFCLQNNIRINPVTCMFFIKIVNELGLVLKSVNNPLRENIEIHMDHMTEYESGEALIIRGQAAKTVNFTILNIYPLMNDDVIVEAMEIAKRMENQQRAFEESLTNLEM